MDITSAVKVAKERGKIFSLADLPLEDNRVFFIILTRVGYSLDVTDPKYRKLDSVMRAFNEAIIELRGDVERLTEDRLKEIMLSDDITFGEAIKDLSSLKLREQGVSVQYLTTLANLCSYTVQTSTKVDKNIECLMFVCLEVLKQYFTVVGDKESLSLIGEVGVDLARTRRQRA